MPLPPKTPLITLMKLEAHHVAQLNKILTMSMNRLDKEIKALGKAGAAPITIMQAKATRAAMADFIGQTFDDVESQIRMGIQNAAMSASEVVSQYEDELLKLVMSPEAANNLARAEAQRAAAGIEAALQRVQGNSYVPLSKTVYNTQQMTLGWVDKRITQALASGWSRQQLANELKTMINPNVAGGVSYAAQRTARTEINNAFHASSAERYLNSPVVLEVDWHLSSSHPEGDICDTLQDESPYPKTEVPKKPHPQCYCYITPSLPEPAKFVDNLFKGKYGDPPTGAEATIEQAVHKAGSKAAKTAAQNAMHSAIKKDVKPSKTTLGNQMKFTADEIDSIKDVNAFQKVVNGLDDVDKKWVSENLVAKKVLINLDESYDLDEWIGWIKTQAKPKATGPGIPVPGDYDYIAKEIGEDLTDILKTNKVSPEKMEELLDNLDEVEWGEVQKIILNLGKDKENIQYLNQVFELDPGDNGFLGNLTQLAKKQPPKKVHTYSSIKSDLGIDPKVVDQLAEGMTPDQIAAQYAKLTADQIADIKKLDWNDQGYYIKHGTTPPNTAFPKPTAGADDVLTPKTTYAELEDQYGIPEHYLADSGMSADDIKATFDWIDEGKLPIQKKLQQQVDDAFDEYEGDAIIDVLKQAKASKDKFGPKTIIDPPTIPKPVVPSPVPPPNDIYETFDDVADIFVQGNWKPNLLAKTGASPQQIADYVEDMNQAQYDHFMSLKWPSQKKHFEKLAKNKADNLASYEAKLEFAEQVAIDTAKIGKANTTDQAVIARWRGKNAPAKPIEPKPPKGPDREVLFKEFLDESKKKFSDFAKATGNAKNDLTKSNNWAEFMKVVNSDDMAALKMLQSNKYVDQDLFDKAVLAMKKANTPDPGDAAKYKSAMEAYGKAKADFDSALIDWRAANGITSQAKGVWDDVLVHESNGAGTAWANNNLPVATGDAKTAVKKYSGSSYTPWNNALRKNASGDTLPAGEWAEWTRKADKAMVPMPQDVIVRRGTSWDEFFIGGKRGMLPPPPPNELIGSVQTQHGYTSTSVGATSAFSPRPVALRIRVPQGHPAAWVDPYSSHKGERELLISRSTNYYIHDVYQEGGTWFIDAEIIPVGEDPSVWTPVKSMKRAK